MDLSKTRERLTTILTEGQNNPSFGPDITKATAIIRDRLRESALEIVLETGLTHEQQVCLMSCFSCVEKSIDGAFAANARPQVPSVFEDVPTLSR